MYKFKKNIETYINNYVSLLMRYKINVREIFYRTIGSAFMEYTEERTQNLEKILDSMQRGLEIADLFINKNYLININKCKPIPLESHQRSFSYISMFEISKIVYDAHENINDKLVSVYSALSNFGSSALLVIFSDMVGVKFYIGTRNINQPNIAKEILGKSLRGNFPGIEIREQSAPQIERLLESHIPDVYSNMAVSAVSIVSSPRDNDKDKFVQGMEKFIDSMSGEKYTAVLISSPLSKADLENKKRGYEELYSTLSQCAQANLTYSENNSEAIATGISDSFSKSINEGISDTTGTNMGTSSGTSKSRNRGQNFSLFIMGVNSGTSRGTTKGSFSGSSTGHTDTYSESESTSKTKSNTTTTTEGTSASIAITKQNKTVQVLLKKIDEQLERIKSCEAYGLWDSACYFISENPETSIVAANTYKALVAGEKTSVENSFINLWSNEFESSDTNLMIMDYLRYGLHPQFRYLPQNNGDGNYTEQIITPASMISGVEVPIFMGIPRKSVPGVTSINSVSFGRNVFVKEQKEHSRNVDIGAIYHMGEVFENNRVKLDLESLTAHCFITGSTGSGKSNTTYKIIEELIKNNITFLVIEPAKGEYKLAFGGMPDINIFTTNPKYYDMLCINPFEFNEEIHVLEHLDRLIEIFSACWPLYAAMPALLKASFEKAYIFHGWDLNHSIYINQGNGKFPTFKDVVEILPELLEESKFSAETKGDYIGALVTRVESLTNGLVGQIFTGQTIDDNILFNQNTIVDLSRIGSIETKALLMGVLILKLSEFRQSTSIGMNLPLKHVTILEEAHNLLKKTSTDQNQESANLQGKSVEMISNSIAEMRTFGEGFIIVDQSPTSVDISAIKNTNTKIIMRLPEKSDCEVAGHSIGLKDEQIMELTKLDKGVAAIYQNNWLEAVLAKIDKCSNLYEISTTPIQDRKNRTALIGDLLTELITQEADDNFNMSWFNTIINSSKVSKFAKTDIRNLFLEYQKKFGTDEQQFAFSELIFKLMNCNDLFRIFEDRLSEMVSDESEIDDSVVSTCRIWSDCIYNNLDHYADFYDKQTKDQTFINLLLHKIQSEPDDYRYKLVLYCIG
ncbi:hypothetical protein DU80_19420 [Methanosarcina mazei]|uniref:Helicase HerA central domain-containing protein n=2 Tax=Methanosarcina mazei TaxID=2209 RepID=A0A0F8JIM4_METMZ|nr:hypothetical protein DU47_12595 [Methanosarcina mazei]KKG55800.1 hypothetical protein DU33_07875 [Methanosarcina mazei]KKG58789.1 hypothetical protein DU45_08315 [Methanosarcina mazei]KKG63554.1 hypothetical protein DU64_12755 [Methanosarcina mazei]KKH01968.1 hypothetical protein DU66_13070 [Methanosarcina mazei]